MRDGLRRLRRHPAFSLFAVATLGLGVGLNTALFSVVHQVLIAPLPIPESEGIMMLSQRNPRLGAGLNSVSPAGYLALQQSLRTLKPLAAFQPIELTMIDEREEPRLVRAARVTPSFFRVVPTHPSLGRTLAEEDLVPPTEFGILEHGNAVFVSERLWREAFGARPSLVGRSIFLEGRRVTVVGIASAGFDFPMRTDVWVPMVFGEQASEDWGSFRLGVIGRVEPGRSLEDAQADANGVASLYRSVVPAVNEGLTFPLSTIKEWLVRDIRSSLTLLFVLTGLVVLIICANLTSLLLVATVIREREFVIRTANGAAPGDLLTQLMGEVAIIVVCASVAALAMGALSLSVINLFLPESISSFWVFSLDLRSLVFCLLVAMGTGVLTVVWPARRAAGLDLAARLRGLGTAGRIGSRGRAHTVFVSAQVALAIVIGTASWVLTGEYVELRSTDRGFEPEGVAVAEFTLPFDRYATVADRSAFLQSVLDRVDASRRVSSAGATIRLPIIDRVGGTYVLPPDPGTGTESGDIAVTFNAIAGSYFRTLSIDFVEGQGFDGLDDPAAPPVAVISRELRRVLFSDQEAVGRDLVLTPWPGQPRRIVGVVDGVAQGGLAGPVAPAVYVPYGQIDGQVLPHLYVLAQGEGPVDEIASDLKSAINGLDPGIASAGLSSLELRLAELKRPWAAGTWVATILGLLAMGLALSGVYATTARFVAAQAREAGVRSALGAGPLNLIWFLSRRGAMCLIAGLPFGLAGGLVAVRVARVALPGGEAPGLEAALIVFGAVALAAGAAIVTPTLTTVRRRAIELIQHGASGRSQ
ncbi:MAG: ABC transporter permease [Gemmatimonadetes bacterium]|nr:ABC transporter permease [Gemmatimonadota bacterium]